MRITKQEFGSLSRAVFKWCDEGKVPLKQHDEFLEWGHKALDSFMENPHVTLPVIFQGLYRKFQKSKDYSPDAEAMLLQAEQRANPDEYQPPKQDGEPVNEGKSIMRQRLLHALDRITGDTKSAFGSSLELGRQGRTESHLQGATCATRFRGQVRESESLRAIMRDPFQRAFWTGFAKALGGGGKGMSADERNAVNLGLLDEEGNGLYQKSLTAGASPGSTWMSEDVAKAVFDICPLYGAYKDLRVIQLAQGKTKFVKVTALPTAAWLIPSALQGSTIPADTTLAGSSVSQVCNTLGINIEISMELLADEKVDWGTALLEKIARGVAYGVDWASFAADGTADTTDGAQTGIFKHGDVPVVNAASGHTTIAALTHSDFMLAPAAIAPAGLQHECRFWVHPSFLPGLLQLKDGNLFLCQTPAQNQSGEYTLCGFPMTLTAVAPATGTAGLPVAAFGWGDAYTIGMREDAEIMTGAPKWNQAMKNIRALTRARCDMGDATMFAILKMAGT